MSGEIAARLDAEPSEDVLDTRERLLQVAMRLFAEHGIDRISLKTISDEAGNRNKSAVGYHFENKEGLVHAVLRRLERDLGPPTASVMSELETARSGGAEVTVCEVVAGLLGPVLKLYTDKPYGPDALRVLARIMHDPVDGIPRDVRKSAAALVDRAVALLRRLVPEKPAYLIEHQVHHAVMATVNGLALQERFVARRAGAWTPESLDDIFGAYADYLAAGLSALPSALPPGRAAPGTPA